MTDEVRQKMAADINLSETAYVEPVSEATTHALAPLVPWQSIAQQQQLSMVCIYWCLVPIYICHEVPIQLMVLSQQVIQCIA